MPSPPPVRPDPQQEPRAGFDVGAVRMIVFEMVSRGDAESDHQLTGLLMPWVKARARFTHFASSGDLEDIFQEFMLRFVRHLQHINELESDGHVAGFLAKVVRSAAIDFYRRNRRRPVDLDSVAESLLGDEGRQASDLEDRLIQRSRCRLFVRCLRRMSPTERYYLLLSTEQSQREIAAVVGISRQAVSKRIQKATERLQKLVEAESR